DHAFFEQTQFQRLFGDDLLQIAGLAAQLLNDIAGGSPRCITSQPLLAGFEEFLRPVVVKALGDPFTSAQRGDRLLAAQTFQQDADLLLRSILLARRAPDVLDNGLCRRFLCPGFLAHLRSFLNAPMSPKSSAGTGGAGRERLAVPQ